MVKHRIQAKACNADLGTRVEPIRTIALLGLRGLRIRVHSPSVNFFRSLQGRCWFFVSSCSTGRSLTFLSSHIPTETSGCCLSPWLRGGSNRVSWWAKTSALLTPTRLDKFQWVGPQECVVSWDREWRVTEDWVFRWIHDFSWVIGLIVIKGNSVQREERDRKIMSLKGYRYSSLYSYYWWYLGNGSNLLGNGQKEIDIRMDGVWGGPNKTLFKVHRIVIKNNLYFTSLFDISTFT